MRKKKAGTEKGEAIDDDGGERDGGGGGDGDGDGGGGGGGGGSDGGGGGGDGGGVVHNSTYIPIDPLNNKTATVTPRGGRTCGMS